VRRTWSVLSLLVVGWLVAPVLPATAAAPTTISSFLVGDPSVAGQATDLTAFLGAGLEPVGNQLLTLSIRPYGATGFAPAGHATTDADGRATVRVTLSRNTTVRWDFAGSADYGKSTLEYVVPIASGVSRHVNDRTLRRGQRLVVKGRTFPAKPGCAVQLWRGELRPLVVGPRPVRLEVGTVRSDGTYRLTHRFHRSRTMRIAVVVVPCTGNERGLSGYTRIRVR
jgi:hypothetical protein